MTRPRLSRHVLFLVCAASLAVACGGAQEAKAPGAQVERTEADPRTVEEAEERIARARAEIDVEGGAKKTSAGAADAAPKAPAAGSSAATGAESRTSRGADACASPCRALASMRRAVGALCRMTGNEDARCVDAKKTLADSEARVASCPCAHG
jgi:hypothetical protein